MLMILYRLKLTFFNINVIDKFRAKFNIGKENTVVLFPWFRYSQQQLNSYYAATKSLHHAIKANQIYVMKN